MKIDLTESGLGFVHFLAEKEEALRDFIYRQLIGVDGLTCLYQKGGVISFRFTRCSGMQIMMLLHNLAMDYKHENNIHI